ncbi:hypothetical protein [Flectobacillus sp. BAB-3569]|uniref:hypothetical protein n=1 Tax=Flectobacillus sp. BAB-3569 TaxID=1509483 RepID=UPI000BA400BA|nr:hypothetical protein [Flectobacillus sp. BAB-3569]PAC33287.1 hypothetical protein BWI92_01925 [Flectobacillus sp. BAB-3569]
MKKTLLIILTITVAIITYFIGKSKGWWNLFLNNNADSSSSKTNTLAKLTKKARSLDSTVNEYGVDTAIVQVNWDGKEVYQLKDSERPTEKFSVGYLYDGTIVYQYQENGVWVFSTEPYKPTQNNYGVDTRTILDYYNGIPIYQFGSGTKPEGAIGFLDDGTPVYESWINEGTPDEKKVYYW